MNAHMIQLAVPIHIWGPIAAIPEDRRDGRDVLLWAGHMLVGSWCDCWCDAVGRPVRGVTHWADVGGPEHG